MSLILCGLMVVGAAIVHGATTHRWSVLSPKGERAQAAHSQVIHYGDYVSEDVPSELPVKERSVVSCRRYFSPMHGQTIVVSLTSGPPGAVATHTPDVCYPGSGFAIVREVKQETLDLPNGGQATCLVAEFEKKTATTAERHRIRWAWSINGQWEVPAHPRLAYLDRTELYKLYIVTPVQDSDPNRPPTDNPAATAFIKHAFMHYADLGQK